MHPFHMVVRRCFDDVAQSATRFVFAPECGGRQRITLYPTSTPSRGQAYCCVDGLGADKGYDTREFRELAARGLCS
jgi:hypothetical protein